MKAIKQLFSKIRSFFGKFKNSFSRRKKRVLRYVDQNPYRSFFIVLGLFLFLIIISNILGTKKQEIKKPESLVKDVEIYSIGTAPRIKVLAQVEKSGVITVTALSPGVVQSIKKTAGANIRKGEMLLSLSTNYQGGNSFVLQRSLAEKQYQNTMENYNLQKEIIQKQKDLAEKVDSNSDELRNITDKSIGETNTLISLNSEIITSLDSNIKNLEATNVNGSNDALILSTKQLKSQFLSGINMARQSVRLSEYNSSNDKPPGNISDLQKDLALKQLLLQEKMLDLGSEISRIQLSIARVIEAMMYPSSPLNGTVERIFVKAGQAVNPGTPLAVLSGSSDKNQISAIAYVSQDIAKKASKLEESEIFINDSLSFKSQPAYVTNDAINGSLYGIYFSIPKEYEKSLTEKGFISVSLPIGYFETGASVIFIPLDSIYQTKEQNYVFVEENGIAKSISVELGQVLGSFVEIKSGLENGSRVIVNRNIIAGDKVKSADEK